MDGVVETIGLGGVLAVLAVLGALLGGAAGHWSRGRRSAWMISGAIIGAILLPVAALAALVHIGAALLGMLALAAAVALGGLLG